ncbi:hypothetical protein [Streptomyces fragilis]|uniref:Uncharacterized protein n=1 Tax=Streptomyces fragilis TaxID=67301 RepID=A0ABV2YNY6_9ACTN|nr:hypothetical protein [Streptomyces fragilis]
MSTGTAALLRALVDDAGLFPPTALPMERAVARHRADLAAGETMHTHRFLVPASRVDELAGLLRDDEVFTLGLIADLDAEDLTGACRRALADPRLRIALVEAPLAAYGEGEAAALDALLAAVDVVPAEVPLYVEPSAQARPHPLLAELAARSGVRPLGAKLRCGGVRAELFPDTTQVAAFLHACVRTGTPFKATAGLHEAVRHTSPETGFTHHGYLNLLLATATAVSGGDQAAVRRTLEIRDPAQLARAAAATGAEEAAAVRRVLVSYGSCSTAAPLHQARLLLGAPDTPKDPA